MYLARSKFNDAEEQLLDFCIKAGVQDEQALSISMRARELFEDVFEQLNKKKLTDSDVRELRRLYKRGMSFVELGKQFDINPATAFRIAKGEYH